MTWTNKVSPRRTSETDLSINWELPGNADKLWLDMVNSERKRENHSAISYEVFEIVMDKIEKEWFDLVSSTGQSGGPARD